MAAGGQGAPLAPVYHAALAAMLAKPLAVLNIGGVANVTWIGRDGELVAFDTGPGQWPAGRLDRRGAPAHAFDRDGALARSGQVDPTVLNRLAGRSLFRAAGAEVARSPGLRRHARRQRPRSSCRQPTAPQRWWHSRPLRSRRRRCREPPLRWLVAGGGRHNPAIMAALRDRLSGPVDPVEALGWNGDALEAQCFGFLAARTRAGLPISFPGRQASPRSHAPAAGSPFRPAVEWPR